MTDEQEQQIRLGRYTIQELLGAGGMAEIYRASVEGPEGFAKPIVIKRVKRKFAEQEVFVRMFIDEARINAALDHANIVSVFDFGETDGHYFMAMEYIDGIDLQVAHVRHRERHDGALPWEVAVLILRDVLRGLDYAHRMAGPDGQPLGIIHRDVNLVNVMLRRDGAVKLLDFGCAKASSAIRTTETLVGVIKGKLGYMSPEQTEDEVLDPRTDVFSASIVFHELLTGRRLFYADNDVDMLRAVQERPIPDPRKYTPELPASVVDISLKGLARDRDQRYGSAAEMADALEAIILERRIPVARLRDLVDDLMARDALPAQRAVPPQERKKTIRTWLNLPVYDVDAASRPRLVSGELNSAGGEPSLEQSPAIVTDHRWVVGTAPPDKPVKAALAAGERPAQRDARSPGGAWSDVDAGGLAPPGPEPTAHLPDRGAGDASSGPARIPAFDRTDPALFAAPGADPTEIQATSKAFLVIIAVFVVAAVIAGIWVFTTQ
ncbi:MAG: serine/threonine-protein kinase [bacterium]